MARKDPLAHLERHGHPLPEGLAREVRALGASVLPRLCAMATDREGWTSANRPAYWRALHAMHFLADHPVPAARAALLDVFLHADPESDTFGRAAWALSRPGPSILAEVLPLLDDPARWQEAVEVLAYNRERDERILAGIERVLAVDVKGGVELAIVYGDPALVPILERRFDAEAAVPRPEPEALLALTECMADLGTVDEARIRRAQLHAATKIAAIRNEIEDTKAEYARREAEIAAVREQVRRLKK